MFSPSNLHVVEYQAEGAMAPHSHDEGLFGIIVNGDFVERIGMSERHYNCGCVSFLPAGVTHSQRFGAGGARQIIVKPEAAWLAYLADCRLELEASPFARGAALRSMGQKLLMEMECDDDFSTIAREGIVLEIVAAFGRAGVASERYSHPPVWLQAARDYLRAHADRSLGMKDIARAAGRHEIHVAREFRRYFGLSVGAYLRQVRTERAAHLLQTTASDIAEIALACGFASHAHLCRVFKTHFGLTPTQYRAKQ